MLCALRNPTLRLVSKAKAANGLYRAGAYAAATAAYAVALQIAADAPEACADQDLATLHFNCARAALKEGRHLSALEQAARALERRADYANARMLQAECPNPNPNPTPNPTPTPTPTPSPTPIPSPSPNPNPNPTPKP